MKNTIYLLLTIAFFTSCNSEKIKVIDPGNSSHPKSADLKFLKKKVDFGVVSNDTLLNAKYEFINPSMDTLIINSVSPDCSCTSYTLSKERIPPGDSAYVILQLSTKNKSGPVELYSTISTNTPTKFYNLKMTADVR